MATRSLAVTVNQVVPVTISLCQAVPPRSDWLAPIRLITSANGFESKMAIDLKGSAVCSVDPLLSPSPPSLGCWCSLSTRWLPRVALSSWSTKCSIANCQRRLVLKARRVVVGLQWFIQVTLFEEVSRLSVSLSINCRIT